MRICFLAPATSSHIKKWVAWFASRGHEIHVLTLDSGEIDGCQIHHLTTRASAQDADIQKLRYLSCAKQAREAIGEIAPDVINAHYATSYGTLAALACERPYILSVWGSDVYEFPRKSPLHRKMLQFSLSRASLLFSTSQVMADEASCYTRKEFTITPFGVDLDMFRPALKREEDQNEFVIASVKTLSPKYGIDVLIEAAAELVMRRPDIPLRLRIAGKGPDELMLKRFATGLGIDGRIEWLGYISQEEAAVVWSQADIGAVPSSSSSESFGVSAVEAQACGIPVIISDVPGLMEATAPGKSSLVFPRLNAHELSLRMEELYDDRELRMSMGAYGVRYVRENYDLNLCFERVEEEYLSFQANSTQGYRR